MSQRMTLTFSETERRGIDRLVEADVRPPKDLLRWLLREELKRRGLWPPEPGGQERGGANARTP